MKRRSLLLIAFIAISVACVSCGGGGGDQKSSTPTPTPSSPTPTPSPGDGDTGGSKSETIDAAIDASSPTLDDGSHYATVTFVAAASGSATLTATSSAFDAMLVVEKDGAAGGGSSETVAEDDDSGGVTNAKVTFPVVAGEQYTALIGSPSGDPQGMCTVAYPSDLLTPGSRNVRIGKGGAK